MTVRELKDFIENCNDNDSVTFCVSRDDNPVSECCDVSIIYKISVNNAGGTQICLMPL